MSLKPPPRRLSFNTWGRELVFEVYNDGSVYISIKRLGSISAEITTSLEKSQAEELSRFLVDPPTLTPNPSPRRVLNIQFPETQGEPCSTQDQPG